MKALIKESDKGVCKRSDGYHMDRIFNIYNLNSWKHFKTILRHKYLVMKGCFAVGLYKQGLLHDLSKFSPGEFLVGAKYFQGNQSPNNAERKAIGYSSAWLHHKGRNRHHYEYWIDYCVQDVPGGMVPVSMPPKYIAEMLMDRIAACKVYNWGHYTDDMPLKYYRRRLEPAPLHENTRFLLEKLLKMLAVKGEAYTFAYIKKVVLGKKRKISKYRR